MITIPESVKSIGDDAFYFCSGLTSINLNSSLESIGEYAFANTKIANLTIPETVKSIGRYAFYNCSSLRSVRIDKAEGTLDISKAGISDEAEITWKT